MNKEMTAGKPGKMILNFTIPIFIGNIFQQLYSMADTVIVGKFVGNEALAAVGACGTLMFLIIGFLLGLTAGFTVITAQHYGAGNLQAMRQSVASGAILSAAVSLILTILSMAMMKDILRWMHTPADMYDQAYGYIMVICGGIAAQTLYNLLASILRALGDSRRPLYFLILAAFLNIVLDLLFIIKFGMGAAGAAYATVISQGVSGLLCLFYIMRKIPEAMATYCAQNVGAGRIDRIRKGFRSAAWMGAAYAVATGILIFFFGKYMTALFVSHNVDRIMEYVDIYLKCVGISFIPLSVVNLYRNGIQGMGFGLLPMTAGIAELIGRSGAALAASHFGSYTGICLASPAAWVLAGTLLIWIYAQIMKQYKLKGMLK